MQIRFVPNGKNRTKEVVDALLHTTDGTKLVFERGTYDFYADGTYRSYCFIGCNRSGEKRVVFPLLNLKNVTVDGNGSSFVFHDRIFRQHSL